MRLLVNAYHKLPYPARCAAASLQGLRLRSRRYGPETERLVAQAHERETWNDAEWERWRSGQLAWMLHHAATHVPFYRAQWAERRRRGDRASWEYLENWPVLEKEQLRESPESFVPDDRSFRGLLSESTSGTTGTPLTVWRSPRTTRAWHALCLARERGWHGLSRQHRWAMFGGRVVAPVGRRRPPFWVWNASLRQLYMSGFHLAPDLLRHYLDALAHYRVEYLFGAASSMHALAQEVMLQGRSDLRMRIAITSAEQVLDTQRNIIGAAFHCAVRETYGMAELVAAASECAEGRLHLWPEVGYIELLDGNRPVPPGHTGELVCTGLLNADMPLIRYRVGDLGRLPVQPGDCACGRTLPHLAAVEGRHDDALFTADGRRVWRLSHVFYGLPLREAQIVQHSVQRVSMVFAPAPGFARQHAALLIQRLRERLGPVTVDLHEVREIQRTAAGKLRTFICNIPQADREELLRMSRAKSTSRI
jgi:phenylacetate-CoA ligase